MVATSKGTCRIHSMMNRMVNEMIENLKVALSHPLTAALTVIMGGCLILSVVALVSAFL